MQGISIRFLVRENSTSHGATNPEPQLLELHTQYPAPHPEKSLQWEVTAMRNSSTTMTYSTCSPYLEKICEQQQRPRTVQFSSVAQSCPTLRPHRLQHTRPPCPSPTPGFYSNSYPSSQWCHPTISSSVVPFSTHLQSFPASRSFPVSQFLTSGGQSIGVSASTSVFLMNIQDWFPLGWTG